MILLDLLIIELFCHHSPDPFYTLSQKIWKHNSDHILSSQLCLSMLSVLECAYEPTKNNQFSEFACELSMVGLVGEPRDIISMYVGILAVNLLNDWSLGKGIHLWVSMKRKWFLWKV